MSGDDQREAPRDYLIREGVFRLGKTLTETDEAPAPELPDSIKDWVTSQYGDDESALQIAKQAWSDFKDIEAGDF